MRLKTRHCGIRVSYLFDLCVLIYYCNSTVDVVYNYLCFRKESCRVYHNSKTYLPLIGFLSIDALLPDLGAPLVTGVDILRGEDDPKPTGVCWLKSDALPWAPLIDDDLRTFEPLGESSEFKERFDPALELGLDPPLLPGIPDCLLPVNPICSSRYFRIDAASSGFIDCLGIGKLRSDFSLIWKWINNGLYVCFNC